MTKREVKDLGWRCLTLYLPLILFLIGTLFPFYWIVNTSLKDSVEVLSLPIKYWPDNPTLSNYFYLFEKMGFGNNVANTAFVAVLTTVLVTLLSLLSGALVILCSIIAQTINEQIDPRIRAEQAVREAEAQP